MHYNPSKSVKDQLLDNHNSRKEEILLAEAIDYWMKTRPPDRIPEPLKLLEMRSKKPDSIA